MCGYTVRVTARGLRLGAPNGPLPGHGPRKAPRSWEGYST